MAGLWKKLKVYSRLNVSLIAITALGLLLQGCTPKNTETLSQQQLQGMINESFLSPQIRHLTLMPAVGVQLYLETPEVTIQREREPLAFKFKGYMDADVLGNSVTARLPITITGLADLAYNREEHAFYFKDIELTEAHVDFDVAIFEALIVDNLKKALVREIGAFSILDIDELQSLGKTVGERLVTVVVQEGEVVLSLKDRVQ